MALGWLFSVLPLLLAVEGLGVDSMPQQVHIAATGKSLIYTVQVLVLVTLPEITVLW